MREERGKISGDQVINELYTLWGMVIGDVTVVEGGRLYLRGSIFGDLIVAGGRAHIFGQIKGRLIVKDEGKVVHSGVVRGDILNRGGRIYIELAAKTLGKIKTKDGTTKFEEKERYLSE